MHKRILLSISIGICALSMGAQTLTATYVELADSADYYISRGLWEDAERLTVKALRHEPANKSNFLLWSNLGTIRYNLENYEGSLEAFDISLATAPNQTATLSNRAQTYLALGMVEEAKNDLSHALEVDSRLQWPRKMRGLLRAIENDYEGAEEDFNIYRNQFGADAAISEMEGDIHLAKDEGNEAIECYREAYGAEPSAELLTKLLVAAHFYNRLEEMEPVLWEGIRTYPREGSLYLMRALLEKSRYQTSAMEADLKMARELNVDKTLYKDLVGDEKK